MTPTGRSGETLSRRERITRAADFRAAYAHRARAADGRLAVYARPNGRGVTRLGLSVGRRVGAAVERNRTKRLLREAFRRKRAEWPAGHDVVVVALRKVESLAEADRGLGRLVPEAVRRAREKARAGPAPGSGGS